MTTTKYTWKHVLCLNTFQQYLLLYLRDFHSESYVHSIYCYLELRKYRKNEAFLAKAHLIFQKYFQKEALYYVEFIPDTLVDEVKQILWKDADGADSMELVNAHIFDPISASIEGTLKPVIEEFMTTSIYESVTEKRQKEKEERTERTLGQKSKSYDNFRRRSSSINKSSSEKLAASTTSSSSKKRSGSLPSNLLSKDAIIMEDWDEDQVCEWLESCGLDEAVPFFQSNSIIGEDLLELTKKELVSEIGLSKSLADQFLKKRDTVQSFVASLNL